MESSKTIYYIGKTPTQQNKHEQHPMFSCSRPQIRPNTGFFKQLIKYEERLFGEASVKMVYCEAIDKEIPDVYEPDYSGMMWFRQRYGPIEKC